MIGMGKIVIEHPRCADCGDDYAYHVPHGPVVGTYRCRRPGCECMVYVKRVKRVKRG